MKKRNTLELTEPEQQKAVASPIRLEILGQFMAPGGMSIADVAERMGRQPGTLYYHFGVLEDAGIIRKVGTQKRGQKDEALYEPVAERFMLAADSESQDQAAAALKTTKAAFRMAVRDLESALQSTDVRTSGRHRNFYASRLHCRLTKDTLSEINKHLREIEKVLLREARRKSFPPDADQYCSLTLALLPLRGRSKEGEKK